MWIDRGTSRKKNKDNPGIYLNIRYRQGKLLVIDISSDIMFTYKGHRKYSCAERVSTGNDLFVVVNSLLLENEIVDDRGGLDWEKVRDLPDWMQTVKDLNSRIKGIIVENGRSKNSIRE